MSTLRPRKERSTGQRASDKYIYLHKVEAQNPNGINVLLDDVIAKCCCSCHILLHCYYNIKEPIQRSVALQNEGMVKGCPLIKKSLIHARFDLLPFHEYFYQTATEFLRYTDLTI